MQTLVWLTTAATLVAGSPHVQCRCPSGAVKGLCAAPAAAEGCCCCSKAVNAEDAPPTCCEQTLGPIEDSTAPALRQDGCQKELVPAAHATMQRLHVDGPVNGGLVLAVVESLVIEIMAPSHPVAIDVPPLPPPVDRQLVLQHFVI